ncbi:MAG: DUF924 domain-containing protein [Lentisphaeraceae bacterium]|nr:DUF924 domain-containing protein [Lentisphaeraceae bacterium]
MNNHMQVINFWFGEIDEKQWFVKDENFDELLRQRFSGLHHQALNCELYSWRRTPFGRLAEIIILDQFSRNMFRDTPKAFAADSQALCLAQEAVQLKLDVDLALNQKSFLYMPYMHSESAVIHQIAIKLFTQPGLEENLKYEQKHQVIIGRFKRYPHRNDILGRVSTDEEIAFLEGPGSSF